MAFTETGWQEDELGVENYRAFLLRCWQEPGAGEEGEPAWRFILVAAGGNG